MFSAHGDLDCYSVNTCKLYFLAVCNSVKKRRLVFQRNNRVVFNGCSQARIHNPTCKWLNSRTLNLCFVRMSDSRF